MYGKLYGVGVGPGAADLLTLRAVRVLGSVDVILAAASPKNDYSKALDIAKGHISENAVIERLEFPMTRDERVLHKAWHKAAERVIDILKEGKNAAFITMGDPLIYSTFGYLVKTIEHYRHDFEVEAISGITSFQAAAAKVGRTLCESTENLLILPGINDESKLELGLIMSDNTVILKAYKNFETISNALNSTRRIKNAVLVSHVAQKEEAIYTDLNTIEGVPPYLSLILTKK